MLDKFAKHSVRIEFDNPSVIIVVLQERLEVTLDMLNDEQIEFQKMKIGSLIYITFNNGYLD